MNQNPKAVFLLELTPPKLREAFQHASTEQRDHIFLQSDLTLDFFHWPITNLSFFMAMADQLDRDIIVTYREIEQHENQNDVISAGIWMTVNQYLQTQNSFLQNIPTGKNELSTFHQAALSFHFPGRIKTFENGKEVGTRETEGSAFLQSDIIIKNGRYSADTSDTHFDLQEQQMAKQFNHWFSDQITKAQTSYDRPLLP